MTDYYAASGDLRRLCTRALTILDREAVKLGSHALVLERLAITGRRCKSGDCPLARYLVRETDAVRVYVSGGDIVLVMQDGFAVHVRPPAWVDTLITDFDMGTYPALDEDAYVAQPQ
jgi:hypothetical protein